MTHDRVKWQDGVLGRQNLRKCNYSLSYRRRYLKRLMERKIQNNDGFSLPETVTLFEYW